MNTSELETLIRTILSEQLAPTSADVKGNGLFQSVDEAINAAHQAFLRYQQCPLKPEAPLSALSVKSLIRTFRCLHKRAR